MHLPCLWPDTYRSVCVIKVCWTSMQLICAGSLQSIQPGSRFCFVCLLIVTTYKTPIRHQNCGYASDTYRIRICIRYSVDTYPLSIWKRKRKKIGYWGRYVLATIAHYRIRFGLAEAGRRWLRLSGKKERSGGGVDRAGPPAVVEDGVWIRRRGGRRVDPATVENGVWIRRHGGRPVDLAAVTDARLFLVLRAAPSLPHLRGHLICGGEHCRSRERERERANKRERERCGHATLIEKKKCGTSAPGANEKANPRSVQMGWDG
jgi:hypothetical protein